MRINVLASGAVILGNVVACDGFFHECSIRVQTHVHKDHWIYYEQRTAAYGYERANSGSVDK